MVSRALTTLVLLMAVYSCLSQGNSPKRPKHKVREAGSRPIQYHVCGDIIYYMFIRTCFPRTKRSVDNIFTDKETANNYLKRGPNARSFNIVEECCSEGCVAEEIHEYCPPGVY